MPSFISAATLLGALSAVCVSAAPTPVERATCTSTFPTAFKIEVTGYGAPGYFTGPQQDVVVSSSESAGTTYFVNATHFAGDNDVPQLAYSLNGQEFYSAWVSDSTNGFITFRDAKSLGAAPGIPVEVSLQSDCTIDFTLFESKTSSILQECNGELIYLASSLKSGCTAVTATLVDGTPQ